MLAVLFAVTHQAFALQHRADAATGVQVEAFIARHRLGEIALPGAAQPIDRAARLRIQADVDLSWELAAIAATPTGSALLRAIDASRHSITVSANTDRGPPFSVRALDSYSGRPLVAREKDSLLVNSGVLTTTAGDTLYDVRVPVLPRQANDGSPVLVIFHPRMMEQLDSEARSAMPSDVSLFHELVHALNVQMGEDMSRIVSASTQWNRRWKNLEERRVIALENRYRAERGCPPRHGHLHLTSVR